LTNLQEFLAGTNPRDAGSSLELHVVGIEDETAVLEFQAAAGKSYSVLFLDSLSADPWVRLTDVPAGDTLRTVRVSDEAFGNSAVRFYRVVTPAIP
jgi:hypothetical protein